MTRSPGTGGWGLPGTFVHEGERLADAALRWPREKAGVTGLAPRQLHVFDDPVRDDRGWVLSVARLDVVPAAALQTDDADGDRGASGGGAVETGGAVPAVAVSARSVRRIPT
ncbi:NUDIX domain-containing protein [Curtobacterium sp. MCLR17_007]|uniref:NUDIX domain-containing protein n=1 Tax=Curtobacterium sp. MCLR17_007 TaxID=2175648 RepID=UPI0021ACC11A|nr:NUDIX domain-containing protein [Curtobacterium sp. MCLR17_007]WIB61446.1 NUDIX domain-containing protein [Curtobacterium sp. MCLR17_007]